MLSLNLVYNALFGVAGSLPDRYSEVIVRALRVTLAYYFVVPVAAECQQLAYTNESFKETG